MPFVVAIAAFNLWGIAMQDNSTPESANALIEIVMNYFQAQPKSSDLEIDFHDFVDGMEARFIELFRKELDKVTQNDPRRTVLRLRLNMADDTRTASDDGSHYDPPVCSITNYGKSDPDGNADGDAAKPEESPIDDECKVKPNWLLVRIETSSTKHYTYTRGRKRCHNRG